MTFLQEIATKLLRRLPMRKMEDARDFLIKVGMPKPQQTDLCCLSLIAMAGIKPKDHWNVATNDWTRIHDIITFLNRYYKTSYAENSRETFRKQAIHGFRTAALIEDNGKATNSPNYRYRITEETLSVLQSLKTEEEAKKIEDFLKSHDTLIDIYSSKKEMTMMPVKINGTDFRFSPGLHNELQKAIIEEFSPRFVPNAECLYVGDTIDKNLVNDAKKLNALGFDITLHDKMPDVVLFSQDKNWIYFVEAVTSVGPMTPKRILELRELTKNVSAGKIFVTAFWNFAMYKKFADCLAWETEVWIANMPDHMIHLNGDKFIGPR